MSETVVKFEHVSMEFPGVLANDDVSLEIKKGEVFALVGENGAGKSTLMNILYGINTPTNGEVYVKGRRIEHFSPKAAIERGVGMVHQHFMLVPSFTVAQNIVLSREPRRLGVLFDNKAAEAAAQKLVEEYGLVVDPAAVVREIGVGLQQRVEILKTLYRGADILILDEPTAVLTPQEAEELFEVIRRVVEEKNMTVILITHRLPEVMRVSDRVGVMRRGRLEKVMETRDTSEREIASLMVGRDVLFGDLPGGQAAGEERLVIRGLCALGDRGLPALRGMDLTVRTGEVVGVCGVEGNGQTELAECVAGMRPVMGGSVTLCGRDVTGQTPGRIREAGLSYIPEDRISTGMDVKASVAENLIVGKQRTPAFSRLGIHLRRGQVKKYAQELTRTFDIRTSGVDEPAGSLSGGNMQKVVLAREFSFGSPVLLVCQPTRGVDIGATEFIHERIVEKRDQGCAVLLISADLDELMRLSDRLVTVFEGKVTGRFRTADVTREEIGYYMTGGRQDTKEAEAR